jgi:hypothetical protein
LIYPESMLIIYPPPSFNRIPTATAQLYPAHTASAALLLVVDVVGDDVEAVVVAEERRPGPG